MASFLEARIDRDFTYHAPTQEKRVRYAIFRGEAKALARLFAEHAPEGRELSLALTKLEEAVFWANAAIARNE